MNQYTIRVRFVELPLAERSLTPQINAVRADSSLRQLTISGAGMEMLTTIVGRGMPPVLRQVVADALVETLEGRSPLDDYGQGNILTEVYGETLGPLLTCLERGGDFEIIRLMRSKGADLLLVNRTSRGVVLQECKGSFVDFTKVREDGSCLDVCQQIRKQRNEGKQQLDWPEANEIASRRLRISSRQPSQPAAFPQAERSVVVTVVPDGRLRTSGLAAEPPSHEPCDTNCIGHCLFSPEPTLISVLSSESLDDKQPLDSSTKTFLDWYKACERAIWGSAHGSVGELFAGALSSWARVEISTASREAATPFLIGLLDHAVQQGVYVDFRPVFEACEALRRPEVTRTIRRIHDLQGDMPRPRIAEIDPGELGGMLYAIGEQEQGPMRVIGNWRFRLASPGSEAGQGTLAEASIRMEANDNLTVRLAPAELAGEPAPVDLRWGLSSIISARSFPPRFVYELFTPEVASWASVPGNRDERQIRSEFVIGHVLWGGSPYWFPFLDKRMLREMHRCCPDCDMFADWIEHRWHRFWFWHHPRHYRIVPPFSRHASSLAFVTNDARGFMTVPIIGT